MTDWQVGILCGAIGWIIAHLLQISGKIDDTRKPKTFKCQFYISIVSPKDDLLATGRSKRPLELPFPPYPGLFVSENMEIGAGDTDNHGVRWPDYIDFRAGPIEAVTWNAESDTFDCQVKCMKASSKKHCNGIISHDRNKAWEWSSYMS